MPSHRDRSTSPRREHHHHRSRNENDLDIRGNGDKRIDRDRTKKPKRRREPTPDSEEANPLDLKRLGVDEIADDDYLFARHDEGRVMADEYKLEISRIQVLVKRRTGEGVLRERISWLVVDDESEQYLDEMSSEAAHKYFRKFVRVRSAQ